MHNEQVKDLKKMLAEEKAQCQGHAEAVEEIGENCKATNEDQYSKK